MNLKNLFLTSVGKQTFTFCTLSNCILSNNVCVKTARPIEKICCSWGQNGFEHSYPLKSFVFHSLKNRNTVSCAITILSCSQTLTLSNNEIMPKADSKVVSVRLDAVVHYTKQFFFTPNSELHCI